MKKIILFSMLAALTGSQVARGADKEKQFTVEKQQKRARECFVKTATGLSYVLLAFLSNSLGDRAQVYYAINNAMNNERGPISAPIAFVSQGSFVAFGVIAFIKLKEAGCDAIDFYYYSKKEQKFAAEAV